MTAFLIVHSIGIPGQIIMIPLPLSGYTESIVVVLIENNQDFLLILQSVLSMHRVYHT